MSADLFAEFNELSNAPQTSSQQPTSSSSTQEKWQVQTKLSDPFDFGQSKAFQSENTASTPSPQWLSFPTASNTAGSQPWEPKSASVLPETDNDDGWGDFEVAEPASHIATKSEAPPAAFPNAWTSLNAPSPTAHHMRPSISRVDTGDLMTNTLVNLNQRSETPIQPVFPVAHQPRGKAVLKPEPRDPNVLFDVDDFELQEGVDDGDGDDDDDDFGDFETVVPPVLSQPITAKQPQPPAAVSTPSMDLLSLDDISQPSDPTLTQKERVDVSAQKQPGPLSFGALTSTSATAEVPTKQAANTANSRSLGGAAGKHHSSGLQNTKALEDHDDDDDDWGAWDDMTSGAGATKQNNDTSSVSKAQVSWDWSESPNIQSSGPELDESAPPPVNVPPPSVILSAFPELFSLGDFLFKPVAGQSGSVKQRVLSDPKVAQFLHGYILLAMTAARVIAGRKHRWHRDKILAKSMSISAAGSKGMKLAGVDKTQSAREDREAADVVIAWREHVGRLRSAVAAANSGGYATLKVPELSENMQIQTAKMVPTAPKPCIICGLKREERVSKVDHDVEDSFGEWWVEHWGHRACKRFWIEHEQKLRQR